MKKEITTPTSKTLMDYIHLRVNQVANFYVGMKNAYIIRSLILIITGSFLLPSFGFSKKKYLLGTHRLLNSIPKDELKNVVLIGGLREFLMALKYKTGFINTSLLYISCFLYCFFSEKFRQSYSKRFSSLIHILLKIDQPFFILTDSDALPYPRSICLAAQQADIKIVCIQHGIFSYPFVGIDGSISDLNLVLNNEQFELLQKSEIPSNRLSLLKSVQIKTTLPRQISSNQKKRVVLVGEGWYSHDRLIHDKYVKTLISLKRELNAAKVRVWFRPHPSERYAIWRFIKLFPIIFSQRSKGISTNDIYIGATSTLLAQAASIGGNSIQITDVTNIGNSFKDYGVHLCRIDETSKKIINLLKTTTITKEAALFDADREISIEKLLSLLMLSTQNVIKSS